MSCFYNIFGILSGGFRSLFIISVESQNCARDFQNDVIIFWSYANIARLVFRWSLQIFNCDGNQMWGVLGDTFHTSKWVFRKKSSEAVLKNLPFLLIGDTCILKLTLLTLDSTNFHTFWPTVTKIRATNKFYRIASGTMRQNYDFLTKNFFYKKWFLLLVLIKIN